jgi:hypothetical protein
MGHVLQETAVALVLGVAVYRFLNNIAMSASGSLSIRVPGAASQVPAVHEVQLEQWKFITDYSQAVRRQQNLNRSYKRSTTMSMS